MPAPGFSSPATDPLRNFRFLVTISPHDKTGYAGVPFKPQLGFASISGLSFTTESIPYREGGYNTTVHQIPGQTTVSPLTFGRGFAFGTRQNYVWARHLFAVIAGTGVGQNGKDFRADIEIGVLNHPVTDYDTDYPPVKMRCKVYNAWISTLAYSDLNAGDNALLVEQMGVVHEGSAINYSDSPDSTEAPEFPV